MKRALLLILCLGLSLFGVGCSTISPSTSVEPTSLPSWAGASSIEARALPLNATKPANASLPNGLKLTADSQGLPNWGKPIGPGTQAAAKPRASRAAAGPARATGPARGGPSVIINNLGGGTGSASEAENETASAPAALSRIESLYNRVPDATRGKRLLQFGYDSVRPGNGDGAAAVGADYQVGPGDELQLRSTGGLELDDVQTIDREGRIFIERVGPILVTGTAASELSQVIKRALEREYQDVQLSVSLSKVRELGLTVTGFVNRPGPVSVSANASLLDILGAAGGVQKTGTLRAIRWTRGGSTINKRTQAKLDLYAMLLEGRALDLPQVRAGDLLHVPAIGPTAAITAPGGAGIYELASSETLEALVTYAGAANAFTDADAIQLERAGRGSRRVLHDLTAANLAGTKVNDTDVLLLPEVPDITDNPVTLEGAVVRPGTSAWAKGMRVRDLLELGGGLLLDAGLERALLRRRLAGSARDQLVWIDLDALLRGKTKANLELRPHDTVRIFTRDEDTDQGSVSIVGAVRNGGEFALTAGLTLGDLVKLAGGPNDKAFLGESILVRKTLSADGRRFDAETFPFDLSEALAGGRAAQTRLQSEDHIVVREMQSGEVSVSVSGHVQFPGTYTLERGAKITDLVAQAGGLLEDADLRASVFSRQRVRNQQQQRLNDMFTRTTERHTRIRNLNARDGTAGESLAGQLGLQGLKQSAATADRVQANGRIVLDFLAKNFPRSAHNLELEPGDSLHVPGRLNTVAVLGQVFSPNAFLWQRGQTVKSYIDQAGGMLADADRKQAYVLLANGEVVSSAQSRGRRGFEGYVPGPGDVVLVPAKGLDRSALSKASSGLNLLREAAELGLVGSAIPASGGTATSIPLDIGSRSQAPQIQYPTVPASDLLRYGSE